MAIIAAVALIQTVIAPSAPAQGPYVSALSNVSVDLVFAYPDQLPEQFLWWQEGLPFGSRVLLHHVKRDLPDQQVH